MKRQAERQVLRDAAKTRRAALDPAFRAEAQAAIADRLQALPEFREARSVALYRAIGSEVNLDAVAASLFRTGCRIWTPAFDLSTGTYRFAAWLAESRWVAGPMGVAQPADPVFEGESDIEAVLVPGVAFDEVGNRLGHGAGHYDRLLTDRSALRIAVAFETQMTDGISAHPGDQPMDWIVTERRTIHCRKVKTHPGEKGPTIRPQGEPHA